MQTFKFVIEDGEFEEQIIQQLPFCQPDNLGKPAKRKVTWHTHSPVIMPLKGQVKDKVQDAIHEPFTVHWEERGASWVRGASSGRMQLLLEWQLSIRRDVPIQSSCRFWQAA